MSRTTVEDVEHRVQYDYSKKSDLDIAKHINLALLLHGGISEQDAGFDMIVGLNDDGLEQVARIIGCVRAAATSTVRQGHRGSEG